MNFGLLGQLSKMKKISLILLLLIILLGGFLRLYGLSKSPPSLNWDEAADGYNAYSISETLKDEYGVTLPIFTKSFGEYKSTLPIYLMIPSIKIFGLNEKGVRFPSALLGTIAIVIIFLIGRKIFNSDSIGLASAFVFAIEPWAVHLGRTYPDTHGALFFLLLGFLLFLYSKQKKFLLPVSIFSFMLSMYTYNANKIVIPLFLIGLAFLNRNSFKTYSKKVLTLTAVILLTFIIPFIILAFKGEAFARVSGTNIFVLFGDEPQRLSSEHILPFIFNFIIHNNYFYFVWNVLGRYFAYFSPQNLFLREGTEPVTIINGNSMFNPFEFIFWAVGLFFVIKNFKKNPELLYLMAIAPIPAMVTWNWFQPARVLVLFSVFSILIGVGIIKSIDFLIGLFQGKLYKLGVKIGSVIFISFLGFASAVYLFDSIFVHLPYRDSGNWQPGFREIVPTIYELSKNYDQVIFDTPHAQPYIFYLFYSNYPPAQFLEENSLGNNTSVSNSSINSDFGKVTFRKIYWPNDSKLPKTLFVGSIYNLPSDSGEDSGVKSNFIQDIKDKEGNVIARIMGTQ